MDRYTVGGQLTPVLIGVREISSANVPSPSWVNIHLQYTHGNGAAVALANQTNSNNPVYAVQGVPPTSSNGTARHHPAVGLLRRWARPGYVVANTKQAEVDYQLNGTNVESHYSGTGGVQLSSIFTRAAFALRLGDFNLLISSQITNKSRIMFVRDPVAMAQKAAPFLSFDHDPYAVIDRTATSTGSSTATPRPPTTRTRRTRTPSRWRSGAPSRPATTTCATRSRSSSTPTRGR